MNGLTIVGFGPGSPDLLTRQAASALEAAEIVLVDDPEHPVSRWLAQSKPIRILAGSKNSTWDLDSQPGGGSIVAGFAGNFSLADPKVRLLLSSAQTQDYAIRLLPGLSYIDAATSVLPWTSSTTTTQIIRLEASPFGEWNAATPYRGVYRSLDPTRPTIIDLGSRVTNMPEMVRSMVAPFRGDHPLVLVQFSDAGLPIGHPVRIAELEVMNLPRETRLILVQPLDRLADRRSFDTLLHIVARLRAPDGCPWDREQTYSTIKKHLIEESYEAIAALDEGDLGQFAEELGDILLQVVMYAQLARESSDFTLDDVLEAVNEKLIRRHPHVFGDVTVTDSADVLKNWEKIKRAERSGKPGTFGVPEAAPALMRAEAIQSRAERYGWKQPPENPSFDAVGDEGANKVEQLAALGSALFDAVSVARRYRLDPEEALRLATNRFRTSLDQILGEMRDRGIDFDTLSIERKRDILDGVTTSPRATEVR